MKVLLITDSFPPTSGSHVQRMVEMANCLSKQGLDIYVLTCKTDENHPTYDKSFIGIVDSKIKIIRVSMGFFHRKAYSTFKNESDKHYNKEIEKNNFIKSKIYNVVTKFKDKLFFPDTLVDWHYEVINYEKKNKVVKNLKPDVIISCSQPNSVHMTGYKLSKKYNIPLYMDIADPWAYIGEYEKREHTLRFKRERKMEEKIIKHAVGISFSAPGCRDLYIEKYNIPKEKTTVVMAGFEERLLEKARTYLASSKSEKITLTYGGALHAYVRDPKPFFKAIKKYEEIFDVTLRTDNIEQAQKWLEECENAKCIFLKPYLSFDEYFEEMLGQDLILFFGNKNDVQLPGKIFNCLATGKFILYIKANKTANDTVEQILKDYGKAIICKNDVDDIQNALKKIILMKNEICEENKLDEEKINKFSNTMQYRNMGKHLQLLLENNIE